MAVSITSALAARIVAGDLAPGAALRQDHVAVEFRTSHVPVREAFRHLEAQGLLVSLPRRGVRVAPLDASSVTETAEMRAALEALALRHAMPRIARCDLEEARSAIDDDAVAAGVLALEAANRRFHGALTRPCGMPRLCRAIADLQQASARAMIAMWRTLPDWQPRSAREHLAILDVVASGRAEEAVALLEMHIREGGRALAERLDKDVASLPVAQMPDADQPDLRS